MNPFVMPCRFLRGSALRLFLTVAAVASGVALVCAIDLVNRAVYTAFVEIVDTMAGRAALRVTAGEGALIPEEVAGRVAAVDGVEVAVPVVASWAFLTDGSGEQLAVHGVDVTNDDAIRVYEPAGGDAGGIEDPLEFLNRRDSIVLTEPFAARHALRVGDALELETPTGRRRFTLRGLLAPKGIARMQGGNVLVMDIASAELAFTKPGLVNQIDIVVRNDASLPRVRDLVVGMLPPDYRVDAPEQRRVDLQRVIQSLQRLFQAVSVLGLAAAFLIAFSRLSTVFEGRMGQLAILRAVGVRRGWVRHELLAESVLIGGAGIAIGIPAGIALAHLLLPVIATATAIGAKLVSAPAVVRIRPASIATATVLGFGAVIAAAAAPVRRAARVPIVATLQGRAIERSNCGSPVVGLTLAILGVTAAAVLAHVRTGHAWLGLVASALLVALAAVAARPLLGALALPIGEAASRVAGSVTRFAVAGVFQAPRRSALTIAMLGVGFGTVLWLWTLATSFEYSLVEVMPGVLRGDLVVASANVGAGYIEAPLDESILEDLARVSGVRTVVGEQTADWQYEGGPIALNGFDPTYFRDPAFGRWRFVGRVLPDVEAALARGEAALLSENFVHNIGGRVGDSLTLDTPSGPVSLRVGGIVADFLSSRGTVILSRSLYRERWHNPHVTHALVALDPGTSVSDARAAIQAAVGTRHRVRVLSIHELVDWFAEQARRAFSSLHVLGALVLVVVLVGVGDALTAANLERSRDLAVTRALGGRRRMLFRIVVCEAGVLAILGLALTTALGLSLGVLWVKSTFPSLVGWTLSLHVPIGETLLILVGAVVVSLVAAYLPARRAAALDPVDALRTD